MRKLRKIGGDDALARVRAEIEKLEQRKKALEDELGAFLVAEDRASEAEELRREVRELEIMLEQRRKEADMQKNRDALDTIEKAAGAAGADVRDRRRSAEDAYEDAVREIAKREGCDMRKAHYLASKDPVMKRAYADIVELQERERAAERGARRLGAYVE